uniref:Uncharacterized protein n=1 Tax=viral metagenome TaxID=1070528 RepID=A0A6C0HRH1_9ZZZZ
MLGNVQKLIVLITILLMIGFIIMLVWVFKEARKKNWPPDSQPCPDYWTMNNGKCKYGGNNGTCPSTTSIDFSSFSDCDKSQWATNYSDGKLYGGDNGTVNGHTFCSGGWGNYDYNVNKNMSCLYGIDNLNNGARISCDATGTLDSSGNIKADKNYSFFCTNSSPINPSCGSVEWDGISYGNNPCEK